MTDGTFMVPTARREETSRLSPVASKPIQTAALDAALANLPAPGLEHCMGANSVKSLIP